MGKFHRLDHTIEDQGGSEARAESEKEHPPTLVITDRLHGCIVDNAHGATKGTLKIEPDPTFPEIAGLCKDLSAEDDAGVPERHALVAAPSSEYAHRSDHLSWGHARARTCLALVRLTVEKDLDVSAAEVDRQNPVLALGLPPHNTPSIRDNAVSDLPWSAM